MFYRIVAADPGLTTGLVSFTIDGKDQIGCIESYQLDLVGIGNYFSRYIEESTIICYEVANKFQASGHMSSEVIGLVKYFASVAGAKCVPVTQSSHKRLITKEVLKRANLDVKGDHAKDAARVGLFHSVTKLGLGKSYLQGERYGPEEDY